MDFKSSNAVKVLIKRSDRLCLLYVLILGGFGIPFFIICVNQCLTNFSARFVVSGLIGLGFIIGAGILGKKLVTKDYGTGISDYFADHPETDIAELDRDFAEAEHIVKNLWIGDKCTYHMGYLYPYIIENKDLIWVYLTHTSGKQSHWDVNFCDKNKKMTSITMKFGKKAKRIVEIYNNKFPHLVVGFNEDLEKMYNEDLEGFLNLRYNQHA